jgi:hypothetical protein
MTPKLRATLLFVLVVSVGLHRFGVMSMFAQPSGPWTNPIQVPAAVGGNGPQLRSSPRGVTLSWLESNDTGTSLKFTRRTTSQWSVAATVAAGDDWFVTDADTPSVLELSNGVLVANWMQSASDQYEASNLRLTYSKDGGKTWTPSFLPHHDGTDTQHAFATLFELPGPTLGVVWLDGRQTTKDREHGPMSIRYTTYDAPMEAAGRCGDRHESL